MIERYLIERTGVIPHVVHPAKVRGKNINHQLLLDHRNPVVNHAICMQPSSHATHAVN
jgi:hypothetical protein